MSFSSDDEEGEASPPKKKWAAPPASFANEERGQGAKEGQVVELLDDEDDEDKEDEDHDQDQEEDRLSSDEDGNPNGEKKQLPTYLNDPVWDKCHKFLISSGPSRAGKLDSSNTRLPLNLIIHKLKKNIS